MGAELTYSSRRTVTRFFAGSLLGLAALTVPSSAPAQQTMVRFNPSKTQIAYSLKDILHTVHGTFKLKRGAVVFDPATGKLDGAIVVDATSGESGNGIRDRKMHREILESEKYPEISFLPEKMLGGIAPQGWSTVTVSGRFRLHGQDHVISIDAEIRRTGRQLEITAHFDIPYVQWGLKNPSRLFLRVNKEVQVEVHAVADLAPPADSQPSSLDPQARAHISLQRSARRKPPPSAKRGPPASVQLRS
jgi:polyisoprenoid-binding protein YceI